MTMEYPRPYLIFLLFQILLIKVIDAQVFDIDYAFEVDEDAGTITINVLGNPGDDVAVGYRHLTTDNNDFDGGTGGLPDGSNYELIDADGEEQFYIDINNDDDIEDDEVILLILLDDPNDIIDSLYLYILNDDADISFASGNLEVFDEGSEFCFDLERHGYLDTDANVDIRLDYNFGESPADGIDTENEDTSTVTFTSGQRFQNQCFGDIVLDDLVEDTEVLSVVLQNPQSTNGDISIVAPSRQYVRIADRTVSFSFVMDIQTHFEGTTISVAVRRGGYIDRAASVDFDYTMSTGTGADMTDLIPGRQLDFAAGDTVLYFDIADLDTDAIVEGLEYFYIDLENSIPATGSVILEPSTVTILIEDQTSVFSFTMSSMFVQEGSTAYATVRREGGNLNTAVSVELHADSSTAGTDDYSIAATRYTFSEGEVEREIRVGTIDSDDLCEDTETFSLQLVDPTTGWYIGAESRMYVFIDDRTTKFSFIDASIFVHEGNNLVVTVRREGGNLNAAQSIGFTYSTTDTASADDYTILGPTARLDFDDGEVEKHFTAVSIDSDVVCEDTEYFFVHLDDPSIGIIGEQEYLQVFIGDRTTKISFADQSLFIAEGDSVTPYVNRQGGSLNTAVVIGYTVLPSSATAADVSILENSFTFPVEETSVPFNLVDIVTDDVCEDTEYFDIVLTSATAVIGGGPASIRVYIEDRTTILSFVNEQYYLTEGETFTVHVRRQGYRSQTSDVEFVITDGTADDAVDMGSRAAPSRLQFDPQDGVLSHDIFDVLRDDVCEGVEYIDIALSDPNNGIIGEPSTARVYIEDDTSWIYFEESRYRVEEGDSLTIRVRRGGNLRLANSVDLSITEEGATDGGVDFEDLNVLLWTVTFSAGDEFHDRTFPIVRDAILEDTEAFTVELTTPQMNDPAIKSPSLTTIFIEDRTTSYWIEEFQYWIRAGTDLTVTFHRRGYLGQEDTITLLSTDDSALSTQDSVLQDYTLPDDTVITFPIGATSATKVITTHRRHYPSYVERGVERFLISITIDGDDISSVLESPSTSEVFIYEFVTNYMLDVGYEVVPEASGDWSILITRDGPISEQGSVILNSRDLSSKEAKENSDYEPIVSLQIGFDAYESQVTTTLTIKEDELVESSERLEIWLSSPTGPALTTNGLGPIHEAIIDIADNDCYFRFSKDFYLIREADGAVTITVERFGYLQKTVTVDANTAEENAISPEDYTTVNQPLSFGIDETMHYYEISIRSDGLIESGELFRVDLFIRLGNQPAGLPEDVRHTFTYIYIVDDDDRFRFSKDFYNVDEAAGKVTVTVERFGYLDIPATVRVITVNQKAKSPADYAEVEQRIVFGVEERSYSFDIPIVNDAALESSEHLRMDLFILGEPSDVAHTCTHINIEDEDVAYSLAKDTHFVYERELKVVVTILRHGFLGQYSSVGVSTSGISAEAPLDFSEIPSNHQTIGFDPEQHSATLEITIVDDELHEPAEEFLVILESSVPEELRLPNSAKIIIYSDDVQCRQSCINGGSCVDIDKCACPEEFTGTLCQTDVNECELVNTDVCPGELICYNTFGGYECRCDGPGFYRQGNQCLAVREIIGQVTVVEIEGEPAVFTPSLADPLSEDYLAMAEIMDSALTTVFENLLEFLDLGIDGFSEGSIVVRYRLILTENSPVTEEEANEALMKNVAFNNGYLGDSRILTYGARLTGDLCATFVCLNGGTCVFDNLEAKCICPVGFQGEKCELEILPTEEPETRRPSLGIVLGIAFGVFGFILIILGMIIYAVRWRTWISKENSKVPPEREQREVLCLNRPTQNLALPFSTASNMNPSPNFPSMQTNVVNGGNGGVARGMRYYVTGEENGSNSGGAMLFNHGGAPVLDAGGNNRNIINTRDVIVNGAYADENSLVF